jgi:hypothetical protein
MVVRRLTPGQRSIWPGAGFFAPFFPVKKRREGKTAIKRNHRTEDGSQKPLSKEIFK